MLHTGKLYRAELYDKHSAPYTNVKAVYDANKDRYPNKKLIVTNAHWYDFGAKPCGNYKVAGNAISAQWNDALGFYWSGFETPTLGWSDMQEHDNFIGTVPALVSGVRQDISAAKYGAGVVRACPRTWWGFDKQGDCTVEVTTKNYTMESIVECMAGLGIFNGIVLDSSGSSQSYDGQTYQHGDSRIIYSYLLLWFEIETIKQEDKHIIICIDAGHGGTDTTNGAPDGRYKEHEFTLDMALRLQQLLSPYAEVILTRDTNISVPLASRANIANHANADVFVSIHSNATASKGVWGTARGLCIYTYSADAKAKRNILAQHILEQYKLAGTRLFSNPMQHNKFAVLAQTNMPAVLIEFGFHDNYADVENLLDPTWRQATATATARGICDYCGIKYIEPQLDSTIYRVQVGAFSDKANADKLKIQLDTVGYKAFVVEVKQ